MKNKLLRIIVFLLICLFSKAFSQPCVAIFWMGPIVQSGSTKIYSCSQVGNQIYCFVAPKSVGTIDDNATLTSSNTMVVKISSNGFRCTGVGSCIITGITSGGCVATLNIIVNPLSAPTATATQTFCGSGMVSNLAATGTNIKWYDALTGGNLLTGTTALVNGTTYYASQTDGTCESARTAVLVNIAQPIVYVNKNATGLNNGTSWANAFVNVQDGINACGATEVWVAQGTYLPAHFVDAAGNSTTTQPPNTPGASGYTYSNRDKIFKLKSGVSLYGGFAGTETTLADRNSSNDPTILSGDFNNDDVVTGAGATLTLANNSDNAYHVVLAYNITNTTNFDGFTVKGGNANNNLNNVNFGFGSAFYNGYGGGFLVGNNSNALTLQNLTFTNNSARRGGGIFNNSSATLTNILLTGNIATDGGGIFNDSSASVISKVTIANNKYENGAINNNYSSADISNVIITNNVATRCAGILNFGNSTPTFTNITIANNNISLANGSVIANIFGANVVFKNTIVWGNTGGSITAIYNEIASSSFGTPASTATVSFSNIQGGYAGTGNINTNPNFINASNPIGADGIWFTADDGLQLNCNSPCLNTGTNTGAPTLDILGNALVGANKDMGAYENQVISACQPIFTGNTTCETYTVANVTGNAWFDVMSPTGIVASINPNSLNLGTITVQISDPSDTLTYQSGRYLSRTVDVTSSNYTGGRPCRAITAYACIITILK